MYGSSYKYGSRIHDSTSTPIEISEYGRNHTADTMALHLQRAFHDVKVFLSLIVSTCRYFLQQNAAIRFGTLRAQIINLKVLGIGNGLTVRLLGYLAGRRVAKRYGLGPTFAIPWFHAICSVKSISSSSEFFNRRGCQYCLGAGGRLQGSGQPFPFRDVFKGVDHRV